MGRMFQITEEDLCELERIVPDIADATHRCWTTKLRKQCEKAKEIISNVRWDYGPPSQVCEIPADAPPTELLGDQDTSIA